MSHKHTINKSILSTTMWDFPRFNWTSRCLWALKCFARKNVPFTIPCSWCNLGCSDGQHVKSRVRRAKAELALARIDEELSADYLVQAKIDLETILVDGPSSSHSSSSTYLEDSPEKLLKEIVLPLLERERIIYYDGYPGGNWELHVKVLEARCWGKIIDTDRWCSPALSLSISI